MLIAAFVCARSKGTPMPHHRIFGVGQGAYDRGAKKSAWMAHLAIAPDCDLQTLLAVYFVPGPIPRCPRSYTTISGRRRRPFFMQRVPSLKKCTHIKDVNHFCVRPPPKLGRRFIINSSNNWFHTLYPNDRAREMFRLNGRFTFI